MVMSRTSVAVSHSKEVNSMSDSRFNSSCNASQVRDVCCIETNRIYDSCRDRDCYENLKVNISDMGRISSQEQETSELKKLASRGLTSV